MRGKRFGLLLTIVAIAQAICGQALGQASALPGSNVMISPVGGGFLTPRPLVSQDLYQAQSCASNNLFYNTAGVISCVAAGTTNQVLHGITSGAPSFSGLSSQDLYQGGSCPSGTAFINTAGAIACTPGPAGTVTSVNHSFTGGLISASGGPVTATGTLTLTVAGTSGGVPYFSSGSGWGSSAALASGQLVQGGGAGLAPSTFALGGDCTLASPNITCTKSNGTAFGTFATQNYATPPAIGGTTANAIAATTLSASGASNFSGGSAGNPTIYGNDAGLNAVGTAPFTFVTAESLASYASGTTHFGFAVNDTKNAVGANSTGSREAFIAQMLGAGGGSADFFTGAEFLAKPTAGANNNSGNFTGDNPYCYIPSGMTPTSCVGQETDITTLSNVTNIREGFRVVDLASTGSYGAGLDAAIGLSATGIGFKNGLYFGESGGGSFPLAASGTAISFEAGTVTNVVDAHLLTVSGNAWQSPGFTVTGSGVATSTGVTSGAFKAAGTVGEIIQASVAQGSAVALVNTVAKTIMSVSLTAGNWNCWGELAFTAGATTTMTALIGGLNTTTNALPGTGTGGMVYQTLPFTTGGTNVFPIGTSLFYSASPQTIYLIADAGFGTSTLSAFGNLICQRQ